MALPPRSPSRHLRPLCCLSLQHKPPPSRQPLAPRAAAGTRHTPLMYWNMASVLLNNLMPRPRDLPAGLTIHTLLRPSICDCACSADSAASASAPASSSWRRDMPGTSEASALGSAMGAHAPPPPPSLLEDAT
eukprot:341079-Chlamydomonas_euryale.AAC.1